MFAADAPKTKLSFAQLTQERVARTIECVGKLRPETGLGVLYKDLRYLIGKHAGKEYSDMDLKNGERITIGVEIALQKSSHDIYLSGFDKCYKRISPIQHTYACFEIDFLCWNYNVKSLKCIVEHVQSLVPKLFYKSHECCVEYDCFITEPDTLLNEDSLIEVCVENRVKRMSQWFVLRRRVD
jgi:hypothetical protein